MRQDSKSEDKENNMKDVEKVNIMNLADKQKSSEDKPQQANKSQSNKMTNIKGQENLEIDQTQSVLDGAERAKKDEDGGKLFDNIKRFENQQKINNKLGPAAKKQLGINEKRKSAPVKSEMIEDLSKIIYNKQLSLQDKEG